MSRPFTNAAATALAMLALTACSAGSSTGSATGSSTGSATDTSPSASATATVEPVDPVSDDGLAGCVVGEWAVDPTSYETMLAALMNGVDAAGTFSHTGQTTMTFADGGGYTTTTDLTSTMTFDIGGTAMAVESVANGTATGTWTADETNLTITVTDDRVTRTFSINGQTSSAGSGDPSALPTVPLPATCDESTLTLTIDPADFATSATTDVPVYTLTMSRV